MGQLPLKNRGSNNSNNTMSMTGLKNGSIHVNTMSAAQFSGTNYIHHNKAGSSNNQY
jgi:hypothetical protein